MGDRNGIRMRVRDWTIRMDNSRYNSRVDWVDGKFTGGNTRFSPGGFRLYSSGGWIRLQYKNGDYAQFKITKRANANGSYIQHYDHGLTFVHYPSKRELCFKVSSTRTGCVSYNISFEAIP